MEEVYTTKEFAAKINVPWQTVAAWKRYGKIPVHAVTPEGHFKKSVIDPIIESGFFEHSTPDAPSKPTRKKRKNKTMKKKTKNYSAKARQEAIRLMFEENYTPAQAAKEIGCVPECARQWKLKHQKTLDTASTEPAKTSVARPRKQPKPKEMPVDKTFAPKKSSNDFDEFARQYWQEGTRAVDVLLLPPEIGPKIVNYVNEALKYAYDRLK